MKLSLISAAALVVGCHAATLPTSPVQASAPQPQPQTGLHVTVDSAHCRESQKQPADDMFVSLVCVSDDGNGAVGVVLVITDWSVLRKF